MNTNDFPRFTSNSKLTESFLWDYTSRHHYVPIRLPDLRFFHIFNGHVVPKQPTRNHEINLVRECGVKNKLQSSQNNVKHKKNCNTCTIPTKSREFDYNILQWMFKRIESEKSFRLEKILADREILNPAWVINMWKI